MAKKPGTINLDLKNADLSGIILSQDIEKAYQQLGFAVDPNQVKEYSDWLKSLKK
jgi:hypothetical protein